EGDDEVADDHSPEQRREWASLRGPEDRHLRGLIPVPDREPLGEDEIDPQQAHHEQELAEVIELFGPEVLVEVTELAQKRHGDDERRDADEDCSGHVVGTEYG